MTNGSLMKAENLKSDHSTYFHSLSHGIILRGNSTWVKERIALGIMAYYANLKFFKSRLVTRSSKLKLYRTVIRPIVTLRVRNMGAERKYNSETANL